MDCLAKDADELFWLATVTPRAVRATAVAKSVAALIRVGVRLVTHLLEGESVFITTNINDQEYNYVFAVVVKRFQRFIFRCFESLEAEVLTAESRRSRAATNKESRQFVAGELDALGIWTGN